MNIFFDFDDVLFNTKRFKKDFADLFVKKLNLTEKEFEKSYSDTKKISKNCNYVFENHLNILKEKFDFDEKKFRKDFENFTRDLNMYIFEDVRDSIEKLHDAGHSLFIVTFGSPFIQNVKISSSGINYFFKDIIITQNSKGKAVSNLIEKYLIDSSDKSIFLDDKIEHLEEVSDLNPNMCTILMTRTQGQYTEQTLSNVKSKKYAKINDMDDFLDIVNKF